MSKNIDTRDLETTHELVIFDRPFTVYGDIEHPLFLAQDVAAMIEYSPDKIGQMLENVDDNEKLTDTIHRAGQKREMWFLTEYGLYELLMQSRKPLARKFKELVKEMLWKIRTGSVRMVASRITARNNLIIENARIMFPNFGGVESKFNAKGNRYFNVVLENPATVTRLMNEGWNIKTLPPREDGDEPLHILNVTVKYGDYPPEITLMTSRTSRMLDEETVGELDKAQLENINIIINPSKWEVNGNTGIKAYLNKFEATLVDNGFSPKMFTMREGE